MSRHSLWIVGHSPTLSARFNEWQMLISDAQKRGVFISAAQHRIILNGMSMQPIHQLILIDKATIKLAETIINTESSSSKPLTLFEVAEWQIEITTQVVCLQAFAK